MREFWDRRADEEPLYFVDNTLDYKDPDVERFWDSGRDVVDHFLDELGVSLRPTDTVVDIGCGVGRTTRALSERTARVYGVDVSGRMLALAREWNPQLANVEWLQGDGVTLSGIATDDVDVCFSHVVFQHIPDPAITLGYVREIGRVLRPDGWAAFQVSNLPAIHRRPGLGSRVRGSLAALRGRAPHGQAHVAWLGSAIDLDDLDRVASAAKLRREHVVGEGTQMCLVLLRKE